MHLLLTATTIVCLLGETSSKVTISLLGPSALYLPYEYNPERYAYNQNAAEKSSFDKRDNTYILYVVGKNLLHIVDYTQPATAFVRNHVSYAIGGATDVATCGEYVAVSVDNKVDPLNGRVYVYRGYSTCENNVQQIHEITVGSMPDMLTFTDDCRYLVVAIEGELRRLPNTDTVVDPEGAVEIIEFPNGVDQMYTRRTADFTAFNSRAQEYVSRGVRWVYRGENAGISVSFSQDLEPEYIALSQDQATAWVVLQENNAMARVNIAQARVEEIYPLGFSSWANTGSGLDPSDKDGNALIAPWNIERMKQPDTIKRMTVGGVDYLLTANEGDDKEYESPDFPFEWSESKRGKKFKSNEFHPSVASSMVDTLGDNDGLGRLDLSVVDGRDSVDSTQYRKFYSYGGRGWSIYLASNMTEVWDSGSQLEEIMRSQENTAFVFNGNARDGEDIPEETFDKRSDNKGCEAEVVTYGKFNNKNVIFVATERPGMIFIYTLDTSGSVPTPSFESVHYNGGDGDTWNNLYEQRISRDVEVEDIKYLEVGPPSMGGQPLMVSIGILTGTVSFYRVHDDGQQT